MDLQDRRVQRTRSALRNALLALIAERGFDVITVRELAEAANVGRATFYKHYADKEDCLRQNLAELGEHLRERMRPRQDVEGHPALAFSLPTLEHVAQAGPMFASLLTSSGSSIVEELFFEVLCELIEETLPAQAGTPDIPRSALVPYLASSHFALAKWWVLQASEHSPIEVDQMFRALVLPGLRACAD